LLFRTGYAIILSMELSNVLPWIQIVLSVLLVIGVLMQQSGTELGGAFGGSDGSATYHKKRGAEKFFFVFTIVVAILFAGSTLLSIFA
jgi:protein translocase SecG subunit